MSVRCWWSGHNFDTIEHKEYPIYKTICRRCGYVMWDGGFQAPMVVIEMRLCEQNHLILRTRQNYRFTVDWDCATCVELFRAGNPK